MTIAIPEKHKEENLKLNADAYVDLFHIQLRNNSASNLYLKNGDPVQWSLTGREEDKIEWQSFPIALSGYEIKSDGQMSRPSLQVLNPSGVFSRFVLDGDLNKAYLYRYRVLRKDLDNNRPIFQSNMWIIWQCTSITKNYMVFECRNPTDGNNFFIPGRQYLPPEFPTVVLR